MKHYSKIVLLFFTFSCTSKLFAQPLCGTKNPTDSIEILQLEQTNTAIYNYIKYHKTKTPSNHIGALTLAPSDTFYIPIVFHVIHSGGADSIPVAQINSQLRVLNTSFKPWQIQFRLAQLDPNGSPVTGITYRKDTAYKNFEYSSNESALKTIDRYDVCRYLNVWIVDTMYLIFAGSPQYIGGAGRYPAASLANDGIVMCRRYIGHHSDGSFNLPPYSDEGEVMVHEVGHYLGLYHPSEGNCSGNLRDSASQYLPNVGDHCYDTPPMDDDVMYTYTCNLSQNSCGEGYFPLPDTNHTDPIRNYMSYQFDTCKTQFTDNQRDRMWATLETIRKDLVSEYALIYSGIAGSINKVLFFANETNICTNDSIIIKFNYNPVYVYELRTGSKVLRPFGSITHDTIILKDLAVGNYTITLEKAVFPYNSIDSNLKMNYLQVFDCNTHATYQPEYSNWYFGNHTGIQFTSTGPRYLATSELNGDEGSIAQSKNNGSLLFYGGGENVLSSDAFRVYNRNHTEMPNSPVFGNGSCTQGSIVLPILNDTNRYMLVTSDGDGASPVLRGLRTSIIDMTLDGGNGDIVTATQNTILSHPTDFITNSLAEDVFQTSESMTAIPICDSVGYWLLVSSRDASLGVDKINVFKCDRDGVMTFRADYHIQDTTSLKPSGSIYFMKASPNGTRLAVGFIDVKKAYVYTFDKKTGILDTTSVKVDGNYDMSFSPNSDLLYVNNFTNDSNASILQYDLTVSPPVVKIVSRLDSILGTYNSLSHLQLAPDGKIYYANYGADYLSVINYPNLRNISNNSNNCGFITKGVKISGNSNPCTKAIVINGLPNQIDALPSSSVNLQEISISVKNCYDYCFKNYYCDDKKIVLQNASGIGIDSVTNSDSLCLTLQQGRYFVLLRIGSKTIAKSINVRQLPTFHIYGKDTLNYTNYNYGYTTDYYPFYTYKWKVVRNGIIIGADNLDTVTISAGNNDTTILRMIYTSPEGCIDSLDRRIKFYSLVNISYNFLLQSSYNFCTGDSIYTISGSDPKGATGVYTYQWQKSYTGTGGFYNISGATSKDYISDTTYLTPFIIRRIAYSGAQSDTSAYRNVTNISLNVCEQRIWFNTTNTPNFSGCDFFVEGTSTTYGTYTWQYSFDNISWINFSSPSVSYCYYHIPVYFDYVYVRRKVVKSKVDYFSNIILITQHTIITLQPKHSVVCGTNFSDAWFISKLNNTPFYAEWYYYCTNTSSWHTYPFASGIPFYPALTGLTVAFTDSIKVGFRGYCADLTLADISYSNTVNMFGVIPSTITTQPSSVSDTIGSSVKFHVAMSNSSSFHTYQWYVSTNNGTIWNVIPNTNNDTLIVIANQSCMGGNKYKCVINTICSLLTTDSVTLTVTNTPGYDVWIKDYFDDNGTEPYAYTNWADVFAGHDLWNWWDHSTTGVPATDTLTHYNPEYRKQDSNYVYFKIRNRGTKTSVPTNLRLYWSFYSSGELWPVNWTENPNNYYPNRFGNNVTLGKEITKDHPFVIPAIAVNDSFVGKVAWFAPNPDDYDLIKSTSFCLLARIISCDGDEAKSMTYPEHQHTGHNADSNNNIATRNVLLVDSNSNNLVYNGNGSGGNPINWSRINSVSETPDEYTITIKSKDPQFFNSAVVYLHMNDLLANAVEVNNDILGATKLNPLLMLWNDSPDVVISQLSLIPYEFYGLGLEFKLLGDTLSKTSTRERLEYTTTYPISLVQKNVTTGQLNEAVNFFVTLPGWRGLRPDTTTKTPKQPDLKVIDNFIFSLRPNPANNVVNVLYQLPQNAHTSITIYDINGKEVISVFTNKSEQAGSYIVPVDVNRLAAGTYIVKLMVNGKEYSQKLLLVKD